MLIKINIKDRIKFSGMRTVSNTTHSNLGKKKKRKALLHMPVILVLVCSKSRNISEHFRAVDRGFTI